MPPGVPSLSNFSGDSDSYYITQTCQENNQRCSLSQVTRPGNGVRVETAQREEEESEGRCE